MGLGLTLKDFNIFSKNNELNYVRTPEGKLTLFKLFLPIMIEYLLRYLMNTVSVFIMGRVSDDAVAAIGVANQVLEMFILFYMVISIGASVVINQNLGAGNERRAEQASVAGLYVGGAVAVLIGIVIAVSATPLVRIMQLEEALVPMGASYLRIVMGISVFQAVMTVAMSECRAHGNTLYPVIASLVMNVVNALMGYIVVFRPFETPLRGVPGIAWGRIIAEAVSCALMICFLKKVTPKTRYSNIREINLSVVKDVVKIGMPSGVQYYSYSMTQAVTTAILAMLGSATLSAKIYVYNIVYYAYLLGMALGQANGLLAGRLVGQGKFDRVRKMTVRNLFITVTINVVFTMTLALLRYPLLGIFTSSSEIIALGASVMFIDVIVEIGRGMNHTFEEALINAGDVRFPMVTTLCTTWGLSVVFSYVLGVRCGLGLPGCWIAFAMDEFVRGTIYAFRWRSGRWTTKALVKNQTV